MCIKEGAGQDAFREIISGAHYEEIDPIGCFLFTNIRNTFMSGVRRFVTIFSGLGGTCLGPFVSDVTCDTNSAIVAQIDTGNLEAVRSHVASLEMLDAAQDSRIHSKPKVVQTF